MPRKFRCLFADNWTRASAVYAVLMLAPGVSGAADAWRSSVSVTPVWQGNANIDNGGDFEASGIAFRAGTSRGFGKGHRAGLTLQYDHLDYDFSEGTAFGGAPWGQVERFGFGVPLLFSGAGGWSYSITPSVEVSRERGADLSESAVYGGIAAATRVFAPDQRLGFGMGVFDQLEETKVIPILIVNWRLNERWSLVNPLPAGPVGPAGLELDYRFDNGWRLGLGAAYRSLKFRLSDTGPIPNGVGEQQGIPVFLRLTANLWNQASLVVYAGAIVGGELRVEDSGGNKLREESFDPAPLLGATVRMRF
ncbi:MAG: DUF6268 family outer membrane beta-barrel protein [Ectothiorhodospiraceae bacterium]